MDEQSLKYLPGIDWFDRKKKKNMCYMLNECPSLISTQNIYKYTVFLEIIGITIDLGRVATHPEKWGEGNSPSTNFFLNNENNLVIN